MARPLRIEFPGALYHITSRGNARGTIFDDDQDREQFLTTLSRVIKKHRWICHAYCLLGNHYHMLIETPEGNLAKGMQPLNSIYTQAFNRRHNKVGHLLQGRYKAILIEKDNYLLELCRYIVLNPVAAAIVPTPEAWPWSSYQATAGLVPAPDFLTNDWILAQFGTEPRRRYIEFVSQGLGTPSPWDDLRGIFLGKDAFVDRFEPYLSEREDLDDIPKVQRLAHRPPLKDLLAAQGIHRAEAAAQAHDWGYTLKEIAGFWGVHYSTISRMVKRGEEKMLQCKI